MKQTSRTVRGRKPHSLAKDTARDGTVADLIARLEVTLDNVLPQVVRRIEVPLALRLDRLHLVLQAALGWTNSHLYELRNQNARWGMVHPDLEYEGLDARKARLIDMLANQGPKTLHYLYDFGDGWEHTIKIERAMPPTPGILYPRLVSAIGVCPPEDVSGPGAYQDFLAAYRDPRHERHAEYVEWMQPGTFDPEDVDLKRLTRSVQTLAKRWERKSTAKSKSRN
jgi:hypothetical protein